MAKPDDVFQVPESAVHNVTGFMNHWDGFVEHYVVPLAWKAAGAFALWFIGGIVIRVLMRALRVAMNRNNVDATLVNYVASALQIALRVLLVLAILSVFGVETTSFAAFVAAAGIAIGAAWAGLLSNLAAGIFIIVLRPYKVGDSITAGGVTGTVQEIGIFTTTMLTADMVQVSVGNTKIFSDNIQNFSVHNIRRVDLIVQMPLAIPFEQAVNLFLPAIKAIPEVLTAPPPEFLIDRINDSGYVLAVRPYTTTADYGKVLPEANHAILRVLQTSTLPPAGPTHFYVERKA